MHSALIPWFSVANVSVSVYLCNVFQGPSKRDKHQKHWWSVKECRHMVSVTVYDINHQHYDLQKGVGLNGIATNGAI